MPPRKVSDKAASEFEPVVEEEQVDAPPAAEPEPIPEPAPAPEPVAEPEPEVKTTADTAQADVVLIPEPEAAPDVEAQQPKRGGWTVDPEKGWVAD